MKKEITLYHIMCITALFLLGRISVSNEGPAGRDIWIIFAILPVLAIPLVMIYSRLRSGDNISDIFTLSLGKVLGTIVIIIFSVAAIIIAAGGITLFTVFISSTPIEKDISVSSIIIMSITIGILLYASDRSLGITASITFPIIVIFFIISLIMSIDHMDFGAVLPILENGKGNLLYGFVSPVILQTAPLIFLVLSAKISISPGKISKALIIGVIAGCAVLMFEHLRNVMILGYPAVSFFKFPNYIALTQVSVGGFFQGMEIVFSQAFLLCQPIKSAICLRFVNRVLNERFPKVSTAWLFVIPAAAGGIALLNRGSMFDMVINNIYFKSIMAFILIGIPFIMVLSLSLRKKISKL